MANFTTDLNLPMVVGTSVKKIDERSITRAKSGSPKIRLLQTRAYRQFDIKFNALTYAQMLALDTYYDTWRALTIQFTYDSVTYNVNFGDPPPNYDPIGGNLYDCNVTLLEV